MRKERRSFLSRNCGSWYVLSEAGQRVGRRSRRDEKRPDIAGHELRFIPTAWGGTRPVLPE